MPRLVTYIITVGTLVVLLCLTFLIFTIRMEILVQTVLTVEQGREGRVSWGSIWLVESDVIGHRSPHLVSWLVEQGYWHGITLLKCCLLLLPALQVCSFDIRDISMFCIYPCKGLCYYQKKQFGDVVVVLSINPIKYLGTCMGWESLDGRKQAEQGDGREWVRKRERTGYAPLDFKFPRPGVFLHIRSLVPSIVSVT